METIFMSKSSIRLEEAKARDAEKKAKIMKDTDVRDLIWFYTSVKNPSDPFFEFCSLYGFKYDFLTDVTHASILTHGKVLILLDVFNFDPCIKFINFASNYSIPVAWIHRGGIIPYQWIWSFNLCFADQSADAKEIWRLIWERVK